MKKVFTEILCISINAICIALFTAFLSCTIEPKDNPAPKDTTPPVVSIDSATNNQVVSDVFSLSGTAVDPPGNSGQTVSGINKVYLSIDNGSYKEISLLSNVWLVSITNTVNGKHTDNVYAVDKAGNSSSIVSIIVDYVAGQPVISTCIPANAWYTNTSVLNISGSAVIDYPYVINKVEVSTNGAGYISAGGQFGAGLVNWALNSIHLNEGTNSIKIRAIGNNGKTNYCDEIKLIVDTIPPVSYITNLTNNTIRGTSVYVAGMAIDAMSGVKNVYFAVDGGSFNRIDGSAEWWNSIILTEGIHTIKVYSSDSVGNSGLTNIINVSAAEAIYISSTGNDNNSGLRGYPLLTIQSGVNKSVEYMVNKVYAEQGTYIPNCGLNNINNGIVITNHNVNLLGGWDSTFTTRNGISRLNANSSVRILYAADCTNLLIDGFLIYNGSVNVGNTGGGVYFYDVSYSLITNCIISNNITPDDGGGISIIKGSGHVSIFGTVCRNNSGLSGGGIYVQYSPYLILNGDVNNNSAGYGGGIFLDYSTSCADIAGIVHDNTASYNGGGVNLNEDYGVNSNPSSGIVLHASIINNTANRGSGIYAQDIANSKIAGSVITNNGGKVVYLNNTGGLVNLIITNNTISGTSSGDTGIYEDGTVDLKNHILKNNAFVNGLTGILYHDYANGDISVSDLNKINTINLSGINYTGASDASGNVVN